MTSVKIRTSWTDENVIVEGVRIYKSNQEFDVNSKPAPLVEIRDGAEFYEDFNVVEGLTYFYMLSCFLSEQEVFTECYEVKAISELWLSGLDFTSYAAGRLSTYQNENLVDSSIPIPGLSSSYYNYAGGVLAPNGKIYFVPRNAPKILTLDTVTEARTLSNLGLADFATASAKWWGGVLAPNGKIYCIPYDATNILVIDPEANTAYTTTMGVSLSGLGKWKGAVLGADGKIYCVPFNSSDVLIIDPSNDTATLSNFGLSLNDTWKFSGGVLAPNGKIYCAPLRSTSILIIDTINNVAVRTGSFSGDSKWSSGVLGSDGKVYFSPIAATDVLVVDPSTDTGERKTFLSLATGSKFEGFVMGANGRMYSVPAYRWQSISINTLSQTAALQTINFYSTTYSENWLGGVLAPNGRIYCAPSKNPSILVLSNVNLGANPPSLKFCLSPHINKF